MTLLSSDGPGTNGADDSEGAGVQPVLGEKNCRQKLPTWGVTREFRFGQFIKLHDVREDANGKSIVTPIVLNAEGDIVEPQAATSAAMTPAVGPDRSPRGHRAGTLPRPNDGTVRFEATPLAVFEADNFEAALSGAPPRISITDPERVIEDGTIVVDGREARIEIGTFTAMALRRGMSFLTVAQSVGASTLIQIDVESIGITIPGDELDDVIAARKLPSAVGTIHLDEGGIRSLLRDGRADASTWADDGTEHFTTIRVAEPAEAPAPLGDRFAVRDLAEFLAAPTVPAADGRML
jgi:hypothetical protein